jgi:predicted membrane protein
LKVAQPSFTNIKPVGNATYKWTLNMNQDVPTDLDLQFGVGEGFIDLRGMNLSNLDMKMGVGEVELDLSGQWENSFDASIKGGIGAATIYLPKDAGVKVDFDGGIGDIEAVGLNKDGKAFYNDAYE